MPVVGFNINKIKADIYEIKVEKNINVNSVPNITDVKKKDIGMGMDDVIAVNFNFEVTYEPKIGQIFLEGELLFKSDAADKIAETWDDRKLLDDSVSVEIMNTIMRKCLMKAVTLSDELRLPPPVKFPVVRPAVKDD